MPDLPAHYIVLVRLVMAVALGGAVSWIYSRTLRTGAGSTLKTTLVLLAVLIAMVTQVIGDNVARAFSLVGALSIVRFRTVVRDTRDTAFVIFAVVVGMAAGAQNVAVALIGLAITGLAAFVMAGRTPAPSDPLYLLRVKAAAGVDLERAVEAALGPRRKLLALSTVKQGAAVEATFEFPLSRPAQELMAELNRIDGIQDVRIESRELERE